MFHWTQRLGHMVLEMTVFYLCFSDSIEFPFWARHSPVLWITCTMMHMMKPAPGKLKTTWEEDKQHYNRCICYLATIYMKRTMILLWRFSSLFRNWKRWVVERTEGTGSSECLLCIGLLLPTAAAGTKELLKKIVNQSPLVWPGYPLAC